MHRLIPTGLTAAVLLSAGCTFVPLSDDGATVAQLTETDVLNCESVGEVSTQTRDKVVLKRNKNTVQEELTSLARNEAAQLGANAIVPVGVPEDGRQKFKAYRCN